jgi:uncharacterized protein YbjQ (UPF0145 family)
MLSLLKKPNNTNGTDRKKLDSAKELFTTGQFQVLTTEAVPGKKIRKIVGLAAYRAYDLETAFYGMIMRALSNGAHAIIGYSESAAFHPDGSRYVSCYGTAVRLIDLEKN